MAVFTGTGDDDYLYRTTNVPTLSNGTLMGYFNFADVDNKNVFLTLGETPTTAESYFCYIEDGGGSRLVVYNGQSEFTGTTVLSADTWYHIALVMAGTNTGELLLYLNGNLEITADGFSNVQDTRFEYGGTAYASDHGNVRIACGRIYDDALSEANIETEMASEDPVRTLDLLGDFQFETAATKLVDASGTGNLTAGGGAGSDYSPGPFDGGDITRTPPADDLVLSGTAPTVSVVAPGAINITVPQGDLRLQSLRPALGLVKQNVTNWTGGSNADANSYNTSSATPKNGWLYTLTVVNTKATTPDTPTVTGGGLTWVQATTVLSGTTLRVTVFTAMVSSGASAGALTIAFGGVTQTGCRWSCDEWLNAEDSNMGSGGGSNAVLQKQSNSSSAAALTVNYSPSTWRVNSGGYFGMGHNANSAVANRANWDESNDAGHNTPATRIETQTTTTVDTAAGTGTSVTGAGIALEILNRANGGNYGQVTETKQLVLSGSAPERLEASLRHPASDDLVLSSTAPTVEVSAGTTISPDAGNLVLSSVAPTRFESFLPLAAAAALILSTTAPTLVESHNPAAAAADLVLSSTAPSVVQEYLPAPAAGNLVLSSVAPERLLAHLLTPASDDLLLTGDSPTVAVGFTISPASDDLVLSTFAPELTVPLEVSPASDDLILSSTAPTRLEESLRLPAADDLVLSGEAPTRLEDHLPAAAAGQLAFSTFAPDRLIDTGLSIGSDDLVLSSTEPTRLEESLRLPSAGNLVLSGSIPSLGGATVIQPDPDALVLDSTAPTLFIEHFINPATGQLALTSTAPSVSTDIRPAIPAGSLVLSGHAPSVSSSTGTQPASGDLVLSSTAPTLTFDIRPAPAAGVLALSTAAPSVARADFISPATGQLVFSTTAPSLAPPLILGFVTGNTTLTNLSGTAVGLTGPGGSVVSLVSFGGSAEDLEG